MSADLDSFANIPEAFFDIAQRIPNELVYSQALWNSEESENQIKWKDASYAEVKSRVLRVAGTLVALGVGKGDKVAIISQSRPEWMESDLAILSCGGVSVSVYQSLPAEEMGYILFDSEAQVVFAENQEQLDKLLWLTDNSISIEATEDRPAQTIRLKLKKIISFELVTSHKLVVSFQDILANEKEADPQEIIKILNRSDLAALVYTSGTTGPPKGVMQTHGNHLANCRQVWSAHLLEEGTTIMVFLPLAHSFAKLMGYLGFLSEGVLKFPAISDTKTSKLNSALVTRDIREAGANLVPIVPRLLEKMQAGVLAKSRGSGVLAWLLRLALRSASNVYEAKQKGMSAGIIDQICYKGLVSIRHKIKNQLFGLSFKYAISGGAKLNPETAKFFAILDIEVLEGYGLTETCVATNVNRLGRNKIGAVGPVLDHDIELRIAEDGEILFRGPNITSGYYKREAATKAAWDEAGWFYTGDLGEIDPEGYLKIVGRKKDILVTSYGKNIAPEPIEAQLKDSCYISQAVMVGDARPYCIAIVTIDQAAVELWANKKGIESEGDLGSNELVIALIHQEVEVVNQRLANYEAIKKVIVLGEDFTVENGLLTPTFKIKKKLVLEKYNRQIEAAYS